MNRPLRSRTLTPPVPAGNPAAPQAPVREDARERLLASALSLFAAKGFSQTSTRELAEAARVNVAAISYYFGDKAGLYRAVFFQPLAGCDPNLAKLTDPELPLADVLQQFFAGFMEPLQLGETARLCMKLRYREMLEPTGLWQEEIRGDIQPTHEALVSVLSRHLGCAPDDELQRLVVCITALGVHLHVGHDVIEQVAPTLNQGDDPIGRWASALVRNALAMVEAEAVRRRAVVEGVAR